MTDSALVEGYSASLDRLEQAATELLGSPARVRRPPASPEALERAVEGLGHELPSDVVAFYRLTNGLSAFGFEIGEAERLVALRNDARFDFHDIEVSGLAAQVWGARPEGDTLVLSRMRQLVLLERNGPSPGRVTLFDVVNDFGYRFVAPSLSAMLDAWATVAENGLIEVQVGYAGDTIVNVPPRMGPQVAELLSGHAASPASVWILDT